eukprot:5943250-Prymnesium_polylepis.1
MNTGRGRRRGGRLGALMRGSSPRKGSARVARWARGRLRIVIRAAFACVCSDRDGVNSSGRPTRGARAST